MATPAAAQDLSFRARIEALRRTKDEHTEEKIRRRGYRDSDDHGWIPWDEPIPFTPRSNHPGGGCYGPKGIGENFREWLQQAAAGDSADSSDVKAVRADDDSASGDDGLMTSDSDVELVADDTTP